MTNEQIIAYAVSIVFAPVANLILEKYVKPIMPEAKKLISYIKKFFLFIIRYGLPISGIIDLMADRRIPVDKNFVLFMSTFFGLILYYALVNLFTVHLSNLNKPS